MYVCIHCNFNLSQTVITYSPHCPLELDSDRMKEPAIHANYTCNTNTNNDPFKLDDFASTAFLSDRYAIESGDVGSVIFEDLLTWYSS